MSTAVWIVAIAVGIPVLSATVTRLMKLYYADRERERAMGLGEEAEALDDIQTGLRDLKKRVANLETILLDLERRSGD